MSSPSLPTSRRFVTELLNSLPALSQASNNDAEDSNSTSHPNPLSAASEKTKKQLLSLQVLFPNEFVPALDLLDRHLVARFRICDNQQLSRQVAETRQAATDHEDEQMQDETAAHVNDNPNKDSENGAIRTSIIEHPHHDHADRPAQNAPNDPAEDQTIADVLMQENDTPTLQTPHDAHSTVYYVRSAQQRSSRYSTSYDTTTSYEVRLQAWNCSCPAFAFAAFPAVHHGPSIAHCDTSDEDNVLIEHLGDGTEGGGWVFGGVSLGENMPPVCKHLLACVLMEKCSGMFGAFVEERHVSVEEAAGWAAGWGD